MILGDKFKLNYEKCIKELITYFGENILIEIAYKDGSSFSFITYNDVTLKCYRN